MQEYSNFWETPFEYWSCLTGLTKVLGKTQVAASGHFLVDRTNFGTSYMDRKGMSKHFLKKGGSPVVGAKRLTRFILKR